MKIFKYYTVLLLIFLCSINLIAQTELRFNKLTREDGLSHGLIFSILQDSDGFMWFATQDGLNKYDGYKFTVFQSDKNDSTALSDNWINSLSLDSNGELWIGTWDGGLHKYDKHNKLFLNYSTINERNNIKTNKIQTICADKKGRIWSACWDGGLVMYDKNKKSFKIYKHIPGTNSISENKIYTCFVDKDGIVWIGTNKNGLDRLDPETGKFTNFKNNPDDPSTISHNYILNIIEGKDDKLWIATYGGGLNLFDKKRGTFKRFDKEIEDVLLTSLLLDSNGILWIGSDGGGLYNYDTKNNRFYQYKNNHFVSSSLNDNRIWSLYEDKSGLIWIGTFSGGVNIFDKKKNSFIHLHQIPGNPNSLIDNFIKAIYDDSDGKLWLGTNKGISIYDRKSKNYSHLLNDPLNKNSLSNNRVRSITKDKHNNFWIGTWGGGLNKYNPVTGNFKIYLNDSSKNSISDNYVRHILIDKEDIIWISTEQGLNKLDPHKEIFSVYKHNPNDTTSISSNQVALFYIDSFNNHWAATTNGLNILDKKTGRFKVYNYEENKKGSISSSRIRDVYQDSKGSLWIGTYGEGLNKFDYKTGTFTSITKEDGLPNNVIYNILEDDYSNLWISTNKGLSRYNLKSGSIKNYNILDVLQDNEFNGGAAFKNKSGELIFGGVNGVNIFKPSLLKDNKFMPEVVITDFRLFDSESNSEVSLDVTGTKYFSYDQNYFSIEFASLDYTAPEKNKYMYKLEGINESWINSGGRRYVNYTNLEPGTYTFKLKGSNSDGFWNENETKLSIIISPPFWKTLWFKILFLLFAASTIYALYQYRIRSIRNRNILLEKLVSERTSELLKSESELKDANATKDKFFSIIAHDLKSPFTALLGYADILRNDYNDMDKDEVNTFTESLYQSVKSTYSLLKNLLDWSRFKTGKLECVSTILSLRKTAEAVVNIYDDIASEKSITIKNLVEENQTVFADEYMLQTVLRNLISNAVKFTREGGRIIISSEEHNENVLIKISDDGAGIDKEDLHKLFNSGTTFTTKGLRGETGTGLGLMLCKEFIEKNSGTIEVESEPGKGSKFIITLPKEPALRKELSA